MKYYQEQDILNMERVNDLLENLPDFMRNYVSYMATGSTSRRTILNYVYDIRGFLTYLADYRKKDVRTLTPEFLEQLTNFDFDDYFLHIDAYKRRSVNNKVLPTTNQEAGKARKLSAIKSLYNYLTQYRLITYNPAAAYRLKLKHHKPVITAMNVDEVHSVMDAAQTGDTLVGRQKKFADKTKYRDTALLALMLNTGIRVSECVGIDLDDINWKESRINVHRKGGGNDPDVFLNDNARIAIKDYLENERHTDDPTENALFLSGTGHRITVRSVERIVKKYTQGAVPGKHITPHKLRSTFGTNLYQATGDIHLTSKALNHSSIEVTASHYADVDIKQRKEAVEIIEERYDNQ
ncbi:MAG: tyrosine-type recombinase/integrase [Bilifractor sp.]